MQSEEDEMTNLKGNVQQQAEKRKFIINRAGVARLMFSLVLASAVYAGVSAFAQDEDKEAYEPAGKFVPTEKLQADDTVAFPVDI
jgi:hypothetical protein